jgi:hypothetical protein
MTAHRLLSPMRRRLYPNARTGTGIDNAGSIIKDQRRHLGPGVPDSMTWEGLLKLGWTEYNGPAETDNLGYIVPGSDPTIVPMGRRST